MRDHSTTTSRRTFLTAATCAAVTPSATIASTDPLTALCDRWHALMDEAAAYDRRFLAGDITGRECDALTSPLLDRADAIALEICQTPATTAQGLAAQIKYTRRDLGSIIDGSLGDGFDNILGTLESGAKAVLS